MARRKKDKPGGRAPWTGDPRLSCLGQFCMGRESDTKYEDVHDVDIEQGDSRFPYRTRLCPRCREGIKILHDRGDVNAGR